MRALCWNGVNDLRVETVDEFAYVRQRGNIRKARVEAQAFAKKSKRIDRDAAWKAKRSALQSVYLVERSARLFDRVRPRATISCRIALEAGRFQNVTPALK